MSSDPSTSGEEFSEFVRRPTRTAGDLSEMAEGSAEITTEDVARDLESAAAKARTQTEELLEELLGRVDELAESVRRMERHSDEISELTERVSKIERKIASAPGPRNVDSSPPVEPAVPTSSEKSRPLRRAPDPQPLEGPSVSKGILIDPQTSGSPSQSPDH